MADFRFHVPADCFIGQDALYKLPLVLEGGPERALLVADPGLGEAKMVERLTAVLEGRGMQLIPFDDLAGRPSSAGVEEDRKSTRLKSRPGTLSRMPASA